MPAPFQLIAGHPVLDFINTLDNRFTDPTELLAAYPELLRFSEQAGLLDTNLSAALAVRGDSRAAARSLAAATELREVLASFLYGRLIDEAPPSAKIVKNLQQCFLEADSHRELLDAGLRVQWTWRNPDKHPELPVWILAQSAERLLTSSAADRIHFCRSETCRWLFLDASKNHSRRWCDMKICGNRMKARAFQSRRSIE
jgi:predicted RNA-binding Zn ribbon-like protein